jgi:hypothetical protein
MAEQAREQEDEDEDAALDALIASQGPRKKAKAEPVPQQEAVVVSPEPEDEPVAIESALVASPLHERTLPDSPLTPTPDPLNRALFDHTPHAWEEEEPPSPHLSPMSPVNQAAAALEPVHEMAFDQASVTETSIHAAEPEDEQGGEGEDEEVEPMEVSTQ